MTFLFGKLVWTVVQPGNLFLLCLLAGLLIFLMSRGRRGKVLVGVAAVGFALFAIAPIGQAMLLSLEERLPRPARLPDRIDGILVLGGAVDPALSLTYGEAVFNGSVARLLGGIALARRHPEAKLALIGGEGAFIPVGLPESRATLGFAVEQGIDPACLILEERSRSTHENAAYAKEMIRPAPGETWVLVTSAFHMPRAFASFAAVDWPVIPYPVDYKVDPRTGLRPRFNLLEGLGAGTLAGKEWAGLVGYRLMGWTRQLLPGPTEIKSRSAR
ncbi:MAG: YdcF family protein [Alphaproteobacteria bacterium]|nr:YdcF family protein [Alphaproteobacteria bacterium]